MQDLALIGLPLASADCSCWEAWRLPEVHRRSTLSGPLTINGSGGLEQRFMFETDCLAPKPPDFQLFTCVSMPLLYEMHSRCLTAHGNDDQSAAPDQVPQQHRALPSLTCQPEESSKMAHGILETGQWRGHWMWQGSRAHVYLWSLRRKGCCRCHCY